MQASSEFGVRIDDHGRLGFANEDRQASFEQVSNSLVPQIYAFLNEDEPNLEEILEALRERLKEDELDIQEISGALRARFHGRDVRGAPHSEEPGMDSTVHIKPDNGWRKKHAARLRASLTAMSDEEFRRLSEEAKRADEEGRIVIGTSSVRK